MKFNAKHIFKSMIILTLLVLFGIYYWFYNTSILESHIYRIDVQEINNDFKETLIQHGKVEWDLKEKDIQDISENPQNYRCVDITVTITNTSRYLFFGNGEFKPNHDPRFKNLVCGKLGDKFKIVPINIEQGEGRDIGENFIVKCDGKTDKELYELAKKTSFIITGDTYGFLKGQSKNVCKSMEKSR